MKGLRKRQLDHRAKRNANPLPMKDPRIIIESLEHLKLSKRPGINLFNGFLDPNNHIGDVLFEEIDELTSRGQSFPEAVGMGLGEMPEFPIIFLIR